MRGSEFISRYLETVQAEATRVGKQVSQANLDRLQAMHDKLTDGHDTMDEAMRELASFITDVSSGAGGDTDGDGDNPQGGDDPDGDGRTSGAPETRQPTAAAAASAEPAVERAVEIRADGSHDAFTGTHTHGHSAFGSQGDDASHEHEHSHDGDADHNHSHEGRATGVHLHGVEAVADGVERTVTLVAAGADGVAALSEEQRTVFELGQRVLKQAQDDAIQWAVRAGVVITPEDEQRYRGMLARCSYDDVATFRAGWEQIAKATLSPRGTWTPDRSAPGGGRWTDAPTMAGGRQTAAADPNDPQRLSGSARRSGPQHAGVSASSAASGLRPQSSRASDDASLYTVGGGKRRAGARGGK